ncbi:MAG: Fe-S-cluster containining protein [Myxococcota bacterium]|jgi:Fe-S-cluster containining protein
MMIPEPLTDSACAACTTARCCSWFAIDVTGSDVYRLARGLALQANDFLSITAIDPHQAGADALFFGDDRQAYVLRLKRTKQSAGPGGSQRCGFLMHLGPTTNRCGVYGHRPFACRIFPAQLRSQRGLLGIELRGTNEVCPPNAWSIAQIDLAGTRPVLTRHRIERDIYRGAVRRWNRRTHQHQAVRRAFQATYIETLMALHDALEPQLAPYFEDDTKLVALFEAWIHPSILPNRPYELVGGRDESAAATVFGPSWAVVETIRHALDAAFGPCTTVASVDHAFG